MSSSLCAFARSGEQQELHTLRVELKRIKAFIKLVQLYRGRKQVAVQLRSIRELFQHAGMIREADLNLQMMKQFHISQPVVVARAGLILRQEPARFRSLVTYYNEIIKDLVKSLLKLLRPLRDRKLKGWVNRQLKKIAAVVTVVQADQLHTARKRIKNLRYIYEICSKRLKTKLALNADYLDQLQDVIGKWHDADVAIRLLDAHNAESKKGLSKLRAQRDEASAAIFDMSHDFWDKVTIVTDLRPQVAHK